LQSYLCLVHSVPGHPHPRPMFPNHVFVTFINWQKGSLPIEGILEYVLPLSPILYIVGPLLPLGEHFIKQRGKLPSRPENLMLLPLSPCFQCTRLPGWWSPAQWCQVLHLIPRKSK
jgi:hypothetical protein